MSETGETGCRARGDSLD